jgi:hypothetical protein
MKFIFKVPRIESESAATVTREGGEKSIAQHSTISRIPRYNSALQAAGRLRSAIAQQRLSSSSSSSSSSFLPPKPRRKKRLTYVCCVILLSNTL